MKLIITDIKDFKNSIDGDYRIINPNLKVNNCIGCFGCWIRTPGKCVIHDDCDNMGILMSQSDELIIISECFYGSTSPFVKSVIDRAIGYVQPDFIIKNGEMHHKPRYENSVNVKVCFYGNDITDPEKETAKSIINAMMVNFHGNVESIEFFNSASETEGIAL